MRKTILVNKNNKIKASYYKHLKLIEIKNNNQQKIKVEEETYNAFLKLQEFLKEKEIIIDIETAYIEDQQSFGNNCTNFEGQEHGTGLAIDITVKPTEKEPKEEIYMNIHKYLKDFGFILRYPKNKEQITGYEYNPYHIRYVGQIVSKIIQENNYTLEEYLENFSGIILVNKEKNMTSFDVVNEISHLFGIKRVGHTGTLDPLAEGVLIVTIGKATKVVELLTSTYKEYIAKVKLGIKTDTLDITGNILEEKSIPKITNLEKIIKSFEKTYMQEVPIYSAVKVNGKKLYEYARSNQAVTLPKKEVTIKEINIIEQSQDSFTFKTLVSKGCYIRSLINDIGNALNTYATMTKLTRTKQGKISIAETKKLSDIKNNNFQIYNIDEVLELPTIVVPPEIEQKIRTGQKLENNWKINDKVIFKNNNNQLLGIYEQKEDKLVVWKNFV